MIIIKPPVLVIDVSRHDPLPVDWKNDDPYARVDGVFAKITQGTWWTDPTAQQNADASHRLGLPFGLYHFWEVNDVEGQVNRFLGESEKIGSIVNGRWQEKLAPVLDQEYQPTSQASIVGAELAYQVWEWIDRVEQRLGVEVEFYSSAMYMLYMMSPIFWTRYYEDGVEKHGWLTNQTSKPHPRSGTREGWWAQYPKDPNLYNEPSQIPAGWDGTVKRKWKYWQYTADLLINGLPSHYDANSYNGTLEEWQNELGGGTTPPPTPEPPTGENMEIVAVYRVNIRADHNLGSDDVGDFAVGQRAEVSELWETGTVKGVDYEQWAKTPLGWIAAWHRKLGTGGKLCNLVGTLPTPPTGTLPVLHITLGADKYETKTVDLNPL